MAGYSGYSMSCNAVAAYRMASLFHTNDSFVNCRRGFCINIMQNLLRGLGHSHSNRLSCFFGL